MTFVIVFMLTLRNDLISLTVFSLFVPQVLGIVDLRVENGKTSGCRSKSFESNYLSSG